MRCSTPTRRDFLATSGSCLAYLSGVSAFATPAALRRWAGPRRDVVAQEGWGRLEEVGDGLWALISTPLTGDYTTLSNGGIIAGRSGVVIVEGTASPDGARWMAERARALAGRSPTHVVVTHHHGDHVGGLDGLRSDGEAPLLLATGGTRDRVVSGLDAGADPERGRPWADVTLMSVEGETEIDLGDRVVVVRPFEGHTESDVIIDLPEAGITWCGDLVWNEMFPNYVDAIPTRLSQSVRTVLADGRSTYVPGHGPLADVGDLTTYVGILDDIEGAARAAIDEGVTAAEVGATYSLPTEVGEWTLFNPRYFERAIGAWMTELGVES